MLAYPATGRRPFNSGIDGLLALLYRALRQPPDLADLSGLARDLAESCLAKEPERRPTPDEILATLPPPVPQWLLAAISAAIGRHTARLLDLESPPPMPAQPAPSPSGSPPLTSPAHASPPLTSRRPRPLRRGRCPLRQGRVTAVGRPALDSPGVGSPQSRPLWPSPSSCGTKADGAGAGAASAGAPARGNVPANMVGTQNRKHIRSKKDKP